MGAYVIAEPMSDGRVYGYVGHMNTWSRSLDPSANAEPVRVYDLRSEARSALRKIPCSRFCAQRIRVVTLDTFRNAVRLDRAEG